jgi:hypothetical protein
MHGHKPVMVIPDARCNEMTIIKFERTGRWTGTFWMCNQAGMSIIRITALNPGMGAASMFNPVTWATMVTTRMMENKSS